MTAAGTMTKRQRVTAALRGEGVDRMPLAFWLHNFGELGGRGLLLGPDCSIDPDTREGLLHAVGREVRHGAAS